MTRDMLIDHGKAQLNVFTGGEHRAFILAALEALEREKQIEAILDSSLDDDEKVPVIRLIISGGLRRPV